MNVDIKNQSRIDSYLNGNYDLRQSVKKKSFMVIQTRMIFCLVLEQKMT